MKKYNTLLFGVTLVTFFLFIGNNNEVDSDTQFWSIANIILCAIVFLNERKINVEYHLPYVTIFYILILFPFGISPFLIDKTNFQLGTLNPYSLEIGFYFNALIYFVYRAFLLFSKKKKIKLYDFSSDKSKFDYQVNQNILNISIVGSIISFTGLFRSISGLDELMIFLTAQVFFYLFLTGKISVTKIIICGILILYEAIGRLTSGLIYPLVYFSMNFFLISYAFWENKFKNYLIIVAITFPIIIISVLFSAVKIDYRQAQKSESLIGNIELIVKLINEDLTDRENHTRELSKNEFGGPLWRLSYPLSGLSKVLDDTPKRVPFWEGESYEPILTKFIPRIFWADKPQENMGQLFGHRYRILNEENLTTSINTPLYAEAYMNFGFIFIPFFCIIFGYFLFIIQTHSTNLKTSSPSIDFYLLNSCFIYIIQFESNFSLMVGKFIISIIIFWLLKKLIFNKEDLLKR